MALQIEPAATEADSTLIAATTDTTTVFLWWADGGPPPFNAKPCEGKTPPAFKCGFGSSTEDCQRQVMSYLDKWYADFNIVFTFKRPKSGPYYTVIVTSDGGWCEQPATIGGVAPINCKDIEGGAAFAFVCGRSAKTCASIIAQEQAHTVGLAHTMSRVDVMYPSIQSTTEGFEDIENEVQNGLCRERQNSHKLMLERLGRWQGGRKSGPFEYAATLSADGGMRETGGSNASTGPSSPRPDGGTTRRQPGGDGTLTRPVPESQPNTDDPGDTVMGTGGGCQIAGHQASTAAGSWLALAAGLAFAFSRRRRAL